MSSQLTLLGVGASAGTPVVGCECSTCQSTNKKNYRTRCSSLLTLKNGKNILIDTSPDLRLQSLRETVKKIPLDRMLIETDSPYLAPVPNRGKLNEPSNVVYVAEKIAEIKNISVEEVAETTTENFFSLFSRCQTS